MDFFAAQDEARTRTRWLVALFVLAVVAIIVTASGLAFFALEYDRFVEVDEAETAASAGQVLVEHLDVFGIIAFGTMAFVGFASLFKWLEVRGGGRAVAEMMGGVPIDPNTTDLFERRLMNVVEEMSIASGIPMPEVFLLPHEESINAFAAGLTTSDAVVAVTRGCLEKLSRDELQGVVAHELGHVLGGDMKLNVQLLALLHGILVFAILGRILIRSAVYGGSRRSRNNGGIVAIVAAGVALVLIGYAGYFFGRVIQAAVSRQREYLADASAVQFTRNPSGLLGALKKIGGFSLGSKMSHPRATEIGHALFAQGFRSSFVGLFATHPPLPARIRAIDPSWDGELVEVPEHDAALAEARHDEAMRRSGKMAPPAFAAAGAAAAKGREARGARVHSTERAIAGIGSVSESNVARAKELRDSIPEALLEAAHDARGAEALIYGLCLARGDRAVYRKQLERVARGAAPEAARALEPLLADLAALDPAARLPLVQIALPALHSLRGDDLDRFLQLIHDLVHLDGFVDTFEHALQLVLTHHLRMAEKPTRAKRKLRALPEVARAVSVILSLLAHMAETADDVSRSFEAGVTRLPTIAHLLELDPAMGGYDDLLGALSALEQTSLGIRRKVLEAAASTVAGDGKITQEEADILRAIASVLDCPMPPL